MVQQAQSQATRITSSHRAVSESSSATKPVPEEMSENQKLVPPQTNYYIYQWIGLRKNIYRRAPYLLGKSMVACRFSLKPIH